MTHKTHEKGQAIVLVAAIMVGLIAMLGLAIDGGGLFFLKRDLQNAADAAIVAATYARCVNGTDDQIREAAFDAAEKNGFVHSNDPDGIKVIVTLNELPPGASGSAADYVQVEITAPKEKYFIQVVYDDELWVSAWAAGRCNKDVLSEYGRALTASGSCGNGGCAIDVNASDLELEGGTHSNDCTGVPGNGHTHDDPNPPDTDTSTGDHSAPDGCQNPSQCTSPAPSESPVIEFPDVYVLEQFDDVPLNGDSFVNAAKTDPSLGNRYFKFTSDTTIPNGTVTDSILKTGALIYVEGDVTLSWNGMGYNTYKYTIVATGLIKTSNGNGHNDSQTGSYLADRTDISHSLLLFSGRESYSCNDSVNNLGIRLGGLTTGGIYYGLLYAPHSGVAIDSAGFRIEGAIWAYAIKLSGSHIIVHYRADMVPESRSDIDITGD